MPRAASRLAELLASYGLHDPDELVAAERARAAADRALAADPSAGLALAARGYAALARWDWAAADADLARAYALAPGLDRVIFLRAFQLHVVNRVEEAIRLGDRMARRSPRSAPQMAGGCRFWARRYTEAIPWFERVIALGNEEWTTIALAFLARAHAELSKVDAALAVAARMRAHTQDPYWLANLVAVYALAGKLDLAEQLRRDLAGVTFSPYVLATAHAMLGELDEAMPLFTQAVDGHDVDALMIRIEPLPPATRADPRFEALIARMGFPR